MKEPGHHSLSLHGKEQLAHSSEIPLFMFHRRKKVKGRVNDDRIFGGTIPLSLDKVVKAIIQVKKQQRLL